MALDHYSVGRRRKEEGKTLLTAFSVPSPTGLYSRCMPCLEDTAARRGIPLAAVVAFLLRSDYTAYQSVPGYADHRGMVSLVARRELCCCVFMLVGRFVSVGVSVGA